MIRALLVVFVAGCANADAVDHARDASMRDPDAAIADATGERPAIDALPVTLDADADDASSVTGDAGCTAVPLYDAYATPGVHPMGTVADIPWYGPTTHYPSGDENFSGYGSSYPTQVECSFNKGQRSYLDVTDGCLSAIKSGTRIAGEVQAASDDAFRVVALGFAAGEPTLDAKWTDLSNSYAFDYTAQVGSANNPGFKAFVRYQTEDDLYVGSWRTDGVVQIQRKQCGVYTPLAVLPSYGAPSANAWHTIQMTAVGTTLTLTVDGDPAITVEDDVFPWGTAGIRIDAMDGAMIDDWKIAAP